MIPQQELRAAALQIAATLLAAQGTMYIGGRQYKMSDLRDLADEMERWIHR